MHFARNWKAMTHTQATHLLHIGKLRSINKSNRISSRALPPFSLFSSIGCCCTAISFRFFFFCRRPTISIHFEFIFPCRCCLLVLTPFGVLAGIGTKFIAKNQITVKRLQFTTLTWRPLPDCLPAPASAHPPMHVLICARYRWHLDP